MKNLFKSIVIIFLLSKTFSIYANNKVTKTNALFLIKSDINNGKNYLNEKNIYNSKYFTGYLQSNKIFETNSNTVYNIKNESSADVFKKSAINYFSDKGYSSSEISQQFDKSLELIVKYDDYKDMLNDFVLEKLIPNEEKDIIIAYIDYFYLTAKYDEFIRTTNIFTHYINESDFTEIEKRGMLTIFDALSINRTLIENGENYAFLELMQNNNYLNKKPSLSTICAGNMIVGMLGGSLGGPLGFVGGFMGGLWSCYTDGCFD